MSDICLGKRSVVRFPTDFKSWEQIKSIFTDWYDYTMLRASRFNLLFWPEESSLRKSRDAHPAFWHLSVQRSRGCGGRRQPTAQNTRRGCYRQAEPFKTMLLVCTSSNRFQEINMQTQQSDTQICDGPESDLLISLSLLFTWFQYIFLNGTVWLKKSTTHIFSLPCSTTYPSRLF